MYSPWRDFGCSSWKAITDQSDESNVGAERPLPISVVEPMGSEVQVIESIGSQTVTALITAKAQQALLCSVSVLEFPRGR
jgi:hypothetical protein